MIASYIMAIVLITQKTDALVVIVIAGTVITLFQLYMAHGNFKFRQQRPEVPQFPPGTRSPSYDLGVQRAHDHAHQRGTADALKALLDILFPLTSHVAT